jgi:hypothetical protein
LWQKWTPYHYTDAKSNKKVTDRYYPCEKWKALAADEQKQVREFRAERDQKRGVQAVITMPTLPPTPTHLPLPPTHQGGLGGATVATELTTPSGGYGVGAVMSQRVPSGSAHCIL